MLEMLGKCTTVRLTVWLLTSDFLRVVLRLWKLLDSSNSVMDSLELEPLM